MSLAAQHLTHTINPRERRILTKTLAAGLATFLAFWRASPESVGIASVCASLMIVLDTLIGIACAVAFREFRSRRLRERLVAKILYYTGFVLCGYILGGLTKAYWMILAAWYAVLLIELASVGETLTRLHVIGGKRFGPAEKVLRLIAQAMGEAARANLPQEGDETKQAAIDKKEDRDASS